MVATQHVDTATTGRTRAVVAACLGGAMALFTGVVGWLGLNQYWRFHVHAFDVGIFGQGMWLLSRFHGTFVTIRGLPLFADHSSYVLVLLVPLYWLFPSPATLIVVTVFAMAATAPAAYFVARRAGAGAVLATMVGIVTLLQPAVVWQVRDSFHPEVLVVPLVVAAVALIQRDRHGWAIAAIALALTAKEDVGLLIVPLGLVVAWTLGKRLIGLTIAGLGGAAFLLNFLVLLPAWSPTGSLLYSYRYEMLGTTPGGIVVGLLTKPDVWWDVLSDPKRIGYVAALVCAMPLCVLAPRWLLIGVPTLLANLFTNHGYQYEVQYHYTAYLIVAVVVAGAFGAGSVGRRSRRGFTIAAVAATVIGVGLTFAFAGPTSGWAHPHGDQDRIAAIVEMVPDGEGVSAWTTLAPHFTDRDVVYLFPNPWLEYDYGLHGPYGVDGSEVPDPAEVDWVFVRFDSYRTFDPVIDELMTSGEFRVAADDHPFLLLERIG